MEEVNIHDMAVGELVWDKAEEETKLRGKAVWPKRRTSVRGRGFGWRFT
jgi:hypothetical protein